MRTVSLARGTRLPTASIHFGCQELSTAALSTKQQMQGFTVKDERPSRPRVAKAKRKEYLAQREAEFEAEQEKATSLGLGWGIRSAL